MRRRSCLIRAGTARDPRRQDACRERSQRLPRLTPSDIGVNHGRRSERFIQLLIRTHKHTSLGNVPGSRPDVELFNEHDRGR